MIEFSGRMAPSIVEAWRADGNTDSARGAIWEGTPEAVMERRFFAWRQQHE
jgi:hypothetical protein